MEISSGGSASLSERQPGKRLSEEDLQNLRLAREELSDAKRVLERLDEARRKRPWRYYVCIDKIRKFHESSAPIRVLAGPNRGGKTTAGAFEIASIATGYHPIKKVRYPTPNITWAISLDHQNLGSVMRRRLFSMLPAGFKYRVLENRVILPKPWESEIWFKSVDSEPEKFQGEGIVAAWFDEEPVGPRGHRVFKEVYARRTPGIPLQIFMTFTPLQGLSWSYHYLWDPRSPERLDGVDTFSFDLYDCLIEKGGHWTHEEVKTIESGYDQYERMARVHGQYTLMGGSPYFDPDRIIEYLSKAERTERYRVSWSADPNRPWRWLPCDDGELWVVRPPIKGHRYIVGVDPAGGLRKDRTNGSVWDCDDMVESAFWSSSVVDPNLAASVHFVPLGLWYNKAQLAIETNGVHGGTFVSAIRQAHYPNIYISQNWDTFDRKITHEYGFKTTEKTRGRLLDTMTKMLREGKWLPSAHLLEEMASIVNKQLDNGKMKAEHQEGKYDDHFFAAAIALTILDESPPPKYKPWDFYRPKFRGAYVDSW